VDQTSAHPDPNLLAAFAEHSLLPRERASVTAHLAECADCREYLTLAFPAQESELSKVARQPAGSSFGAWLRRWRWVATAAVACGVLAVALQYRAVQPVFETRGPQVIAALPEKSGSPPPSASSTPDSTAVISLPSSVPSATRHARRVVKTEPQPAVEPSALRELSVTLQPDAAPPRQNAPAPQPDTALIQNPATALRQKASAEQENATALQPNAPVAQQDASSADAATAGFMKSRALASSAKSGLVDAEQLKAESRRPILARRALAKMSATPGVLWSINASPETAGNPYGVVQRSADHGKTWESVALNERVNFRAVAASGDDVWAGGSGGVLFHSPDGGLHWVEISVTGENSSLTGAIVSIDARDPGQLKVATSSRERWISTDRGRHWTQE